MLDHLLNDPELREELARASYFKDREDEVALDREHDLNENVSYMVLDWGCLSEQVRRPYRTAVAVTLDAIAQSLESA